jgi:serine/threonine protein kinase
LPGDISAAPHLYPDNSGSVMPPTDPPSGPPRPAHECSTLAPADEAGHEARTLPPAAAEPADGAALPRDFGRYRLEKLLGRGGMGAVYLAHDSALRRPVAIKVPFLSGPSSADGRARFLREARAAAALAHPNICPVYDVGEVDGEPYLALAFIAGKPLSHKIDAAHPFDPPEAAALVRKVALALHEAHEQGVIHRDLKPANIMIDGRGEPIVMDFGLARRADATQLTQQGEVMGTPAFMPPEQLTGDLAVVGPASDVYSLGVVLYQLLTGALPFQGDLLALVSQVTLDDPAPPSSSRPGLDPRFDAVCLKALAKRPADRWASMREFGGALAALTEPPPFARPPRPVAPADPAGPRLSLRLAGTPFAYRLAPGQAMVTLGRQKRKPGAPDDEGNDIVLRVPGNDAQSARVSRRHLEIRRQGTAYVVIDHSKAGTVLNGRPLDRDVPAPLASGDRLVVAGVITLDVMLDQDSTVSLAPRCVEVPAAGLGPVLVEVSVGDMVTVE